MGIITISRGCYSHGKEIAEKVADRLGYECVSREILLKAAKFFNVPEGELLKSIHDPPSFFERFTHGKDTYLSYIRAALLEYIKRDNVVYHGYGGHLLLADIVCVLKVRVLARMQERIDMVGRQKNLSVQEATREIEAEDRQRLQWARLVYNKDLNDPSLYDLAIQIGPLSVSDACDIICNAVESSALRTGEADMRKIGDLAIESHIRAILQTYNPVQVTVEEGNVRIVLPPQKVKRADFSTPMANTLFKERIHGEIAQEITALVRKIPDVGEVVCDIEMPRYS